LTTITVSITKIPPSRLYLLRWLCSLIGATIVVCQPRKKREEIREAVTP
jgi:hypothetical protein